MKKVQKTAILGGSFDPVTNAHITIIKKLAKKFTRVVVLPCYISPFKQDGCVASGEDRVKMLRKLTSDLDNVKVSKWEIKQEKVSYTVDAVKHYKQKYEDSQIYFVLGSDCLAGLPDWKDAGYLAENVTFLLVRRAGYSVSRKTTADLKQLGFNIEPAGFSASDESSSLVRAAVAFNKLEEFVPPIVAEYIKDKDLYTEYEPFIRAYGVFGLKKERIEHTFRAVKAGIRLAKIYGEDVHEVVTALILHDIGKYADKSILAEYKIKVDGYDDLLENSPSVLHSHVSAAIARDYFGCNERIVSAVYKHTTGSDKMSVLDKIVYLADAVEEGRDYDGVKSIRKIVAKDLDRAMLRSLKSTVKTLRQNGKDIHPDTLDALKYFTEICRNKTAEINAAPVFKPKAPEPEKKKHKKTGLPNAANGGRELATCIAAYLSEKKGRDVVIIDVAQKTVLADCFVIAGAGSTTAVKAMADYVDEQLSKQGIEPLRRDISPKWAVLDYGDVIVHVQHQEARDFYKLEKLWDNGDNITHYTDD